MGELGDIFELVVMGPTRLRICRASGRYVRRRRIGRRSYLSRKPPPFEVYGSTHNLEQLMAVALALRPYQAGAALTEVP